MDVTYPVITRTDTGLKQVFMTFEKFVAMFRSPLERMIIKFGGDPYSDHRWNDRQYWEVMAEGNGLNYKSTATGIILYFPKDKRIHLQAIEEFKWRMAV